MAYFRVVVADKARAVSGKFLEVLGSVDPHMKKVQLNKERVEHWLSVGAQPSDTAYNLLVSEGIIKGEKRKVKIKQKPKEGGEEGAEAPVVTKTEGAPEAAKEATPEKPTETTEAKEKKQAEAAPAPKEEDAKTEEIK